MARFNEDSRVKIPALVHLSRLGFEYLPLNKAKWDSRTNIFTSIFSAALSRINPGATSSELQRKLEDITLTLQNEDLGLAFYQMLTARSGIKLIDFENFDNNSFHIVTELPFENGEDVFRPDISVLINGMPLGLIEVKKRMNLGGVLAERERMNRRHANPKFRHFFNLTQLLVFSNNMEYDEGSVEPIQGAFYAASTYGEAHFNYFREEDSGLAGRAVGPLDEAVEDLILTDNNLVSIKATPEYTRNKKPDTPTNRILTSLFCRERLAFLMRYAFAYLDTDDGIQKHIMRYPQLFATQAIAHELNGGTRKGIIWHTQGSGKTALAYYNVAHLTDHFQKQGVIPRFYFIVDRLDLLKQAREEFTMRGLVVHVIDSRDAFARDIKKPGVLQNDRGQLEITVVNIQKFKDDPDVTRSDDYNLAVQRVYFLDEVHRSYNPRGSFLANLKQSDRQAIKIGLTGTPLIGNDANSKVLFGDYLHKYYYNASIADGYTLRLIREAIATHYQMQLQETLEQIQVQQGGIGRKALYAHPHFAAPMLDYIVEDFRQARIIHGDDSIGAMVICDSAEQARELYAQFQRRFPTACNHTQDGKGQAGQWLWAAEGAQDSKFPHPLTAALILHDEGSKEDRENWVKDYKAGRIDLLFVYNMLLTGFDAPRMKKLYLGRIIKDHNLLQALTRVNRRYKDFRYGYVVDFADIQAEFDKTNRAYYDELSAELGDEIEHYSQLFKSAEDIQADIARIKQTLFQYALDDAELFSQQIGQIDDRKELLAIVKALGEARELHNLIRLTGQDELRGLLDFNRLRILHNEAKNALAAVNLKQQIEQAQDTRGLLNEALEDVIFRFEKIGEAELKLADELKDTLRRTRETLADTQDPQDPAWIALREELERLFKKKKLSEVSQDEMQANIAALRGLEKRAKQLNAQDRNLQAKYAGDAKLMRVHKRLMESAGPNTSEIQLHDALSAIKSATDASVLGNSALLGNESYFERQLMPVIIREFQRAQPPGPDAVTCRRINQLLAREYFNESQGRLPF